MVWKLFRRRPLAASVSNVGVRIGPPNVLGPPKPMSSMSTMTTLGAPAGALTSNRGGAFTLRASSSEYVGRFGSWIGSVVRSTSAARAAVDRANANEGRECQRDCKCHAKWNCLHDCHLRWNQLRKLHWNCGRQNGGISTGRYHDSASPAQLHILTSAILGLPPINSPARDRPASRSCRTILPSARRAGRSRCSLCPATSGPSWLLSRREPLGRTTPSPSRRRSSSRREACCRGPRSSGRSPGMNGAGCHRR